MANYTKHEQNRAEIAAFLDAGLKPRPELPRCACGAPAKWEVNRWPRVEFYCAEHLPENALG